ncbi:MAG: winged helix-turn-helix domain-containing protein, partial [Syntrophales bacterium LBB04]|nr:winged helix-turn-helix domain-containing protein [Syntrophales bacterium LBB04]
GVSEGASEGVSEGASEGVKKLLACIQGNPGLRIPELSEKLHAPAKTIERWIKYLRDEGSIVFKGASKTGGYFVKEVSPPAKR